MEISVISIGEKVADTTDTTVMSCPSLFMLERNAPFQLEANGKKGFFFLCHPSSWTPVVWLWTPCVHFFAKMF